jgi:NodT family efflux transporter outer membrane factor (OMF) lipoprotein
VIALWIASLPILAADAPWWTAIDDPGLHEIMDRTIGGNLDLQSAWLRVTQADARANQVRAGLLPAVSFDASGALVPISALGFGSGFATPTDANTYQTGSAMFSARVPLDVFGRQTKTWQASRHDVLAQQGNAQAQALALTTQAGESWYDLVAATARLAMVREQLRVSNELLELVELRYQSGDGNALEVLQQRQQLAVRQTLLPSARIGVRTAEQRLSVLVGERLTQVQLPTVPSSLPVLGPSPPTADLAQNRPDLRAATATVDGYTALRQSSLRSALPVLAVSGAAGWQFYRIDELDTLATWQVGASVSVPLFGGLGAWNGYQEARANQAAAVMAYRSAWLIAEQEVAQARVIETERGETLVAVRARVEAAELLYTESRSRYLQGLSDYLTVLNALDSRQQAQLDLLQAQRDIVSARIQLYDALGGAWTADLTSSSPTGAP